ncbi:MAG TPA: hypothetical protein VLC72_00565 [Nitrosopumilaceae archaeon]|nr:hypothetical protein [Nitrosopumilaceae archaeon]
MKKIRTTIMIDDNVAQKIRLIQARLIKKNNQSVSFSQVLNQMLRDSLK